jgi:putative hydrolase of the HAD superfamily
LKGILIDFGDTLAYIDKAGNRNYQKDLLSVARTYGYKKNLSHLASVLSKILWLSTNGKPSNIQEFWKLFIDKLHFYQKSAIAIEELEQVRRRHSETVFQLYSGAIAVLGALKQKYKLALVSNCAVGTSDVIEALRLPDYLDNITLSYEIGVRKPGKQIYLAAIRKLRLKPEECTFVADEISDLEGARKLGLKTLLVRQGSSTTHDAEDPHFKPDFQCDKLVEILKFL